MNLLGACELKLHSLPLVFAGSRNACDKLLLQVILAERPVPIGSMPLSNVENCNETQLRVRAILTYMRLISRPKSIRQRVREGLIRWVKARAEQVNQQKQQTLPLLSIIPKTQASPESPDNVNNKNKKLPSPPKTNRSPKARQKTYIYTWQKVLSSDGVTYYYYNTFTQQSQWNPPARGIINTWKKDVANRAGYKIAKDRKSQITSPNTSPKSPARKKANGVKIKVKSKAPMKYNQQ